ncbi:TetR/AcrR family transcriptional regulator [Nocardia sp. NPDC051570]|uniref:TetR/AcrR family transcriptional regulator n=1 Tax=Nocardia sp. NPDC051570 TaxID=3364324 RepID=UPI0037BAFD41
MAPHEHSDGRRVRGQQRYELLLDTALDLVRRNGLPALTIRAVATAAGVSLASITYHFATRDDLIAATCAEAMRRDVSDTQRFIDTLRAETTPGSVTAEELADRCLAQIYDADGWALIMLSLYLECVRRPELAALAEQWNRELLDLTTAALTELGASQPRPTAELLLATLDGLRLPALAQQTSIPHRPGHDSLTLLFSWILDRDRGTSTT